MQGELKAQPVKKICMHCNNDCGWVYHAAYDELRICGICNWDEIKPRPISITMP